MPMETVVIFAIGILILIFLGSLAALIVICQQRYCRRDFLFKNLSSDAAPDAGLLGPSSSSSKTIVNGHSLGPSNSIELDDVAIHPEIDKILADARWVDDVTGLIPHCLAILKSCHHLTGRLVEATMAALNSYHQDDQQRKLWEIIRIAQKISPRVDDVVQSMYNGDARLLEARCLAVVLSVSHLATVIKYLCHVESNWIQESLDELEQQMKVS
ncbi:transmembrane protein 98-like [Panonychus citri]|uniref:transmembrane protein 98-like n=1 Tax=Panonychus citri TaxID=50023 RepID=UPI0023072D8F|nr:transmembrane protein 98-like [Panonychus citri]